MKERHPLRRWIGIALLLAALLQLGFRGRQRVRWEVPLWDFASVYAAARAWIDGGNPYDRDQVIATWHRSGVFSDRDVSYFATVYPPSSLLMIVPLALLPAAVAIAAWLMLVLALLILQFAALADMARLPWRDGRLLILIGGALASAPYQFGILSGQLSMPAISACILAFWCVGHDQDPIAGVLLGLAMALKPQIAMPFVLFYLLLQRLKIGLWAIGCGGVIGLFSILAMHLSHIDWLTGWSHSVALTQTIGGVNDYSWANPFRDEIVDLKILLVSAIRQTTLLRSTVTLIVLILAGWYAWEFRRGRAQAGGQWMLLSLSALSAILLLPIYHRIYDVSLLSMALAWILAEMRGRWRSEAFALLIPMLLFLIPFDIVAGITARVTVLRGLSKSGWWQEFIAPHYAWGLLVLTLGLLLTMRRLQSGTSRATQ